MTLGLPTPELVIFDCDGVLVDTERLAAQATATALTALGWPLTPDQAIAEFLGCSEEHFVAEVRRRIPTLPEGWEEMCTPSYDEVQPVDGVVEVLDALSVPACVASNGPHDKLTLTLGRTGLLDRFHGRVFSAQDVRRGKPAPDLFLHAARTLEVEPERCVVVEDSPRGVAAARAAGMRVVGYAGLVPAERLQGADAVIDDLRRLLPLLHEAGTAAADGAGCGEHPPRRPVTV